MFLTVEMLASGCSSTVVASLGHGFNSCWGPGLFFLLLSFIRSPYKVHLYSSSGEKSISRFIEWDGANLFSTDRTIAEEILALKTHSYPFIVRVSEGGATTGIDIFKPTHDCGHHVSGELQSFSRCRKTSVKKGIVLLLTS